MLALIASIGLLTACEVRFYFPWDSRPETTSSANPTSPITSQSQSGNIDSVPTDDDTPSGMIKHGKNLYLQGNEPEPNENLEIYFYQLENSQSQKQSADAFFIKYGDVEVLIDMGTETIGSYAVMPYLKEHNIIEDNTIELVINTHVDKDHIGGFVGNSNGGKYDLGLLRSSYDISVLLDSGYTNDTQLYTRYVSFRDERIAAGMTYYSYQETMTSDIVPNVFYLGSDTYIQVLDTKLYENNFEEVKDLNDSSVPVLLVHGNNKFLLMGDCEKKAEEKIIQYNNLSKVDFFKANHHGSPTSNTEALLDIIRPDYIVIDSTASNSYNLPKKEIVDRFLKYTENIYAPFINGGIHIYSDKTNITFECDGFIDYTNNKEGELVEGTQGQPTPLQDTSWYQTAI